MTRRNVKLNKFAFWAPWLPVLIIIMWTLILSSVWNFCHWHTDVPLGETSPVVRSEEKGLFLQAVQGASGHPLPLKHSPRIQVVKSTALWFRIESNTACSRLQASWVIMIAIFKNAQDPEGERSSLSLFFRPPLPFPRSGKSYFTWPCFSTSLLNPRARVEQAKRNRNRNWSTMTKHLDLPKNVKTLFFCVFLLPFFPVELCCFCVMMNAMPLCDHPELP